MLQVLVAAALIGGGVYMQGKAKRKLKSGMRKSQAQYQVGMQQAASAYRKAGEKRWDAAQIGAKRTLGDIDKMETDVGSQLEQGDISKGTTGTTTAGEGAKRKWKADATSRMTSQYMGVAEQINGWTLQNIGQVYQKLAQTMTEGDMLVKNVLDDIKTSNISAIANMAAMGIGMAGKNGTRSTANIPSADFSTPSASYIESTPNSWDNYNFSDGSQPYGIPQQGTFSNI